MLPPLLPLTLTLTPPPHHPLTQGVSENIILGNLVPVGTGAFDLLVDEAAVAGAQEVVFVDAAGGELGVGATPGMTPGRLISPSQLASPGAGMSPFGDDAPLAFSPMGGGASPAAGGAGYRCALGRFWERLLLLRAPPPAPALTSALPLPLPTLTHPPARPVQPFAAQRALAIRLRRLPTGKCFACSIDPFIIDAAVAASSSATLRRRLRARPTATVSGAHPPSLPPPFAARRGIIFALYRGACLSWDP